MGKKKSHIIQEEMDAEFGLTSKTTAENSGSKSAGRNLIIGSRGSELALWQANFIKGELENNGIASEIKIIKTQGDKVQNLSFDKMEGKGFFTKELEDALLAKEIDLAVHSHKDLTTTLPKGLYIAAVSSREDPSDLVVIRNECVDEKAKFGLKINAVVGTSSARRKSQLLAFRNDVTIKDLRGNVPTRIKKLQDGEYDAIIIAAAGVERLGIDLSEFHYEKLDPKEFVPAPAQGVLALQVREDDEKLVEKLKDLNDEEVAKAIRVERKILNLFDGGCQLPLGAYCEITEKEGKTIYKVWAAKADAWNKIPKFIYLESGKADGLAEKVVKKINELKPVSVFITRDLRKQDHFYNLLAGNGYEVTGHSLIEIKKIDINRFPKTDWIFFASKHAVKHFFEQKPPITGAKLGAVGKATSAEIRKYGQAASFIGYSTDTTFTAKQFASTVKSGVVLFPQAKGSIRTIQAQFTNPKQVINLTVYETVKHIDKDIPKAEIIVFTSPSNVEAFFEKNKMTDKQKAVAMGDATANALRIAGVKASTMPASFDDIGLVQAVMSV